MSAQLTGALLALRVRQVRYGSITVLRDVALDVTAGEIVGVTGHVGAGKTTLALLAAGLLGHALDVDASVERAMDGDIATRAAFVFANPWTQLTGWGGTVREEVAVGPENLNVPVERLRTLVAQSLDRTAISHLSERPPLELSGGELQRVAIASALAMDAPLLVLDEPSSQLDPEGVAELARLLDNLAAAGFGVLLVEQNLELLEAVCKRVVVLADGAVAAEGRPADVLGRWPPLDGRLGAPAALTEAHDAPVSRGARASFREVDVLLSVQALHVAYDDGPDVLDGLSLTIPRGSVAGWMGPNGAGKSTLARALMGLTSARAGRVIVGGEPLDVLPVEERARHIGLVFQDPGRQLFSATVLEEVAFGPRALGWPRQRAHDAARRALRLVNLDEEAHAHPGDLPPQSRRLVAIAAAIAAEPPLLVLDEPTAGQDASGRATIARVLEEQRGRGAAAVITHDAAFARRHCDLVHLFGAGGEVRRVDPSAVPLPRLPSRGLS